MPLELYLVRHNKLKFCMKETMQCSAKVNRAQSLGELCALSLEAKLKQTICCGWRCSSVDRMLSQHTVSSSFHPQYYRIQTVTQTFLLSTKGVEAEGSEIQG